MSDSYNFFGNPGAGLSYEQLKQRRAIAQALASRNSGFPKNKGEGLTYLGQSIGEALSDLGLRRQEAAYQKGLTKDLGTLRSPATATTTTTTPPPAQKTEIVPPPKDTTPPPAAAAETQMDTSPASLAGYDPDVAPMVQSAEATPPPAPVVAPAVEAAVQPPPPPVVTAPEPVVAPPPAPDAGESWDPNAPDSGSMVNSIRQLTTEPKTDPQRDTFFNPKSSVRDKVALAMLTGGNKLTPDTLAPDQAPPAAPSRPQLPSEQLINATTPAEADAAMAQSPSRGAPVPAPAVPSPPVVQPPPEQPPPGDVAQTPPNQVTLPTQTADIPLPRGNPRTTGGVRATMEAALSRGGQSPAAISGIERNVRDESSFNPNLRHPDQPGFSGEAHYAHGLYQEGGDEWNNYVNWIDKNHPDSDWRDPNLQSEFLADRLQSSQYARTNREMNAPDASPSGAAISFLQGYLKPADKYMAQRTEQYASEGGNPQYASVAVGRGGGDGTLSTGARTGSGGGREGGAPSEDTRDLITQALLSQSQQKPQEQADSGDYLPDVAGMTNRTTLPQRPTAALGRAGVQGDVSLPTLQPMGALTGAPSPAAGAPAGMPPGAPQGGDPRDAIAAAIAAQQSPDVPLADPTAAGAVAPIAPQGPQGPQPTLTDIQPAPIGGPGQQLAQAAPPPPAAMPPGTPPAIPGPLAPPVARPPTPLQAQPETPKQFAQPPVAPTPPQVPPMSEAELRAQALMAKYPDNPIVQQRAQQAIADAEKQRLLPYQRDIEKYKADLGLYNEQYKAWQENQRKQPQEDIELRIKRQELSDKEAAAARSTRLGGIPDAVFSAQIEKSADASKGIPGASQAIGNARQAIKDGMYTGAAADVELQLGKIARAAGYEPKDSSKLANTEAFRAYMAGVTAQARQNLVGSNQISNADLIASQQASGGKITMEPESVLKILDSLERINTASAVQHQGKLLAYSGDDPNAQRAVFGTFGLPMENVVPQGAKELLLKNPTAEVQADFDRTFNTPGLAQRILKYR